MASLCIWMVSVPYSLAYVSSRTSAGSLPGLRAITKPAPKRAAKAPPMMNPRDSIPTTLVMPLSLYISYNVSNISCMHSALLNSVVTS